MKKHLTRLYLRLRNCKLLQLRLLSYFYDVLDRGLAVLVSDVLAVLCYESAVVEHAGPVVVVAVVVAHLAHGDDDVAGVHADLLGLVGRLAAVAHDAVAARGRESGQLLQVLPISDVEGLKTDHDDIVTSVQVHNKSRRYSNNPS